VGRNKRVVVTGATSGLGREVAVRLASLGADVVLACRDRLRGGQVAAAINATAGTERATVMTVDTSDPRSIRAFARDDVDTYGSLDVLVNNAGVLLTERQTDGPRRQDLGHDGGTGPCGVGGALRDVVSGAAGSVPREGRARRATCAAP
jgi:NAD(P)-dependent dehydrogenase (short-subunit alcohol dehydrogenase family)